MNIKHYISPSDIKNKKFLKVMRAEAKTMKVVKNLIRKENKRIEKLFLNKLNGQKNII